MTLIHSRILNLNQACIGENFIPVLSSPTSQYYEKHEYHPRMNSQTPLHIYFYEKQSNGVSAVNPERRSYQKHLNVHHTAIGDSLNKQ